MKRILVTGASGFVGQALCSALEAQGFAVRAAVRSENVIISVMGLDVVTVGEINAYTDWSEILQGISCIIHCAARTHVMNEIDANALAAYRAVNVEGTERLAEQAAAAGVQRLVFVSSIKVLGERTRRGVSFITTDPAEPQDSYGRSKWEAEQALWAISDRTGLEVVIVRPPLVYGPAVKGNMLRLLRWVASGMPLPLGAVLNQRSMIGLSNLVDFLMCCAEHPDAAGQTFLASDGQDLSTSQLIQMMAEGMNRPARSLSIPLAFLKTSASLLGKRRELDRLVDSLTVNSQHAREYLDWAPPFSVEAGVKEMAQWYASSRDNLVS